MVLLCMVLKVFLKEAFYLGNLCNYSCLNVYKGVCLLKNVLMFESLFWEIVLKLCVLKLARMFAN